MKQTHPIRIDGALRWNRAERTTVEFLFGGVGYGLIEVLWRGHTHPSMVVTGGGCFLIISGVNRLLRGRSLFLRSAVSAAGVTAVEFSVGVVVNRWLGLGVWDYSKLPYNLLGQICPLYSGLWFLLCLALLFVLSHLPRKRNRSDFEKTLSFFARI